MSNPSTSTLTATFAHDDSGFGVRLRPWPAARPHRDVHATVEPVGVRIAWTCRAAAPLEIGTATCDLLCLDLPKAERLRAERLPEESARLLAERAKALGTRRA